MKIEIGQWVALFGDGLLGQQRVAPSVLSARARQIVERCRVNGEPMERQWSALRDSSKQRLFDSSNTQTLSDELNIRWAGRWTLGAGHGANHRQRRCQ